MPAANTNASTVTVRKLSCIKDFKNDIVSKLKTLNITGLGTNVYANRVTKILPGEESACIVNIPNVTFADNRSSPRFYVATGDVLIFVYGRSYYDDEGNTLELDDASSVNDSIEDIARQIIEYLDTNIKVGRGQDVNRFYLKSMSNNLSEKECVRGVCAITFGFEFSIVNNWSYPADDFLKAENVLTAGEGDGNRQEFVTNVRP